MTVLCVWFLGVALETLIEKGFYCHAEMHAEEYALDDFLTPGSRVLCHQSNFGSRPVVAPRATMEPSLLPNGILCPRSATHHGGRGCSPVVTYVMWLIIEGYPAWFILFHLQREGSYSASRSRQLVSLATAKLTASGYTDVDMMHLPEEELLSRAQQRWGWTPHRASE